MADSAVAITAGTGTNVDTRTEGTNGNHRQVIVIGDPATNAGVAPVDATAGLKVDLGADNDITGTVTANLGATDNAVLDDIAAKLATIDADTSALAAGVSTEYQVDIVSSALPTGAATSAKQDTQITAEQAIQTSVELIDDAVRAEDVASGDGHKGVVMMAVRQDTPANTSGTDGDYEMPKMSAGRLWVDASGKTLTVDGSGVTQPVSNAGLTELAAAINSSKVDVNIVSSDVATGGTSAADDADFTAGTTPGTPAQGVYESTPTSVTDGDLGTVGITAGRRMKTSATIDAALPAGTNNIGDVDVLSSALPTGASTLAEQQTQTTALQLIDDVVYVDDTATHSTGSSKGVGIMAAAAPTDTAVNANDIGMVGMTVGRSLYTSVQDALPAGTNAIGKLAANSGVDIGDVDILSIAAGDNNIGNVDIVSGTITTVTTLTGGGIAHDSADSGNPHKMGAKAYSPDGTTPGTAVAEADRTDLKADLDGRLFTNDEHPRWGSYHENSSSALTDTSVVADPGDGFQVVITNIIVSTGAATAFNFFLEEGSTTIFGPIYLEAVAGRGFCTPAGFKKHVTASTAVTITTSAAIAHSIDIQYYIQAV